MRFFKRLLGRDIPLDAFQREGHKDTKAEITPLSARSQASDIYFDTMLRMQAAIATNDFETAAKLIRQNVQCIPDWVQETRRQYGSLDIGTIPALQQGGRILALVGDEDGLSQIREIVASTHELERWIDYVERHQYDLRLFKMIFEVITNHPNCLQTEVKGLIGEEDGHRIATLISYLERAGKITRTRHGRTYKLISTASPDAPKLPPKRTVGSHRQDQEPPELREIDISKLSYVPLPRAPLQWDEALTENERAKAQEPKGPFEILDGDWRIESIENIPPPERPDPAFRRIYPSDSGLFMVDDLGKAEGLGRIEAAALRYDRLGNLVAKAGLQHDAYRIGVHPLGRCLITMSRGCVIHAYDDRLALIIETTLAEAPEILALRRRFDIPADRLKNHIRCVALSREAGRYLFTAVDEAWCVGIGGKGLWGAKLPTKEGWRRVPTPSADFQTSDDVKHALDVMGLSLPVVPDEVKRRYRELAKQWHPDLNPSDDQAHKKMKALNLATETLTGIEKSSIPFYVGSSFIQEENIAELEVNGLTITMTVGIVVGEIHASDWIYASCFAAKSDSVYLAGYSGRVIQVDQYGEGVRVYDIGRVPRRIIDTGDYLYLLTDTRLYILRDDALIALVDTFEAGDLIVTQAGFGLLERKRLRWFSEVGRYMGCVVAKDPIRRIYSSEDRMIVETRQQRAVLGSLVGFLAE